MNLVWKTNISEREWDRILAQSGGHPLQSAFWGSSRAQAGDFEDQREAAFIDDRVVWMTRYEVRWLPGKVGRVAWIPKGPVLCDHEFGEAAHSEFFARLKRKGFWLAIENQYSTNPNGNGLSGIKLSPHYRTIWLDLTMGEEALWKQLHRQWRYHVRVSRRDGVTVEQTRDPEVIAEFYEMCLDLSKTKGFSLPGSEALMKLLLARDPWEQTESRLFIARYQGEMAAGVSVLRCGSSIHYIWGATQRKFGKHYVGEAVQWGVIEWAIKEGLARYDLEGINPENNPGVYKFKKRMGGEEIELSGQVGYPLNVQGKLALFIKQKLNNRTLKHAGK